MKKTIANRIASLIDIKSFITIALIVTLCVLAYRQNVAISTELLAATIGSVITYFFTRKSNNGNDDK
jgi:uncharacterized membrane protein YdjX (TVP38/TMEM64 family)